MEKKMETRVAVIAIIIEDGSSAQEVNELLHGAAQYIIGRMGIPYRDKGISIISIAIDAPQDIISTLSGKIGRLKGCIRQNGVFQCCFKRELEPQFIQKF